MISLLTCQASVEFRVQAGRYSQHAVVVLFLAIFAYYRAQSWLCTYPSLPRMRNPHAHTAALWSHLRALSPSS